ncbi:MAG: lysine--tRNA ligase, partial [Butyrivibrio sp.]|nr:lysine--tRNA ligase [Butyrivibrio sp.]
MEANNQQNNQNTQEDVGRLRQVRRDKLSELQAEGRDPFQIVKYDQTHHTKDIRDNFEALEFVVPVDEDGKAITVPLSEVPAGKIVSLAGRMMSKRVMGKASFANLQDKSGRMQLYVSRNDLGDEPYAAFKKMDIG